jgi:CRP-like cAMP-binding protein/Fe-S-cluster-containing hydrogenase component 2
MLHSPDIDSFDELAAAAPARWRPAASKAAIAQLAELDSLSRLPEDELVQLVPLCVLRAYESGEIISSERSVARRLFILLHGSVSLTQADSSGTEVLLSLLGRGDLLGEGGLFGLKYRRVSAHAETRVLLLQITYDDLHPLLPGLPTFRKQLRQSYRERLLQTTLARTPLLGSLTATERIALIGELDERQLERGERLQPPGQADSTLGKVLHIIAEGQATVERDGRRVAMLNPGDFFGEMELLGFDAPAAEIVALTPMHLLTLPAGAFSQLLRDHPTIASGMRDLARQRLEEGHAPERVEMTERAIDSGVVRGRRVLARIPALCPPGCNLCEQACANRHGASRIHLNGTAFGAFDVPQGCMHCTWSPECRDACPENAFRLGDMGLLFVNDRCTGCGACVDACPYDAVTMIPLYPPVQGPLDWMLRVIRRPPPVRMDANICDGCHGFSDQACLSICPTGSLRWVSADDLYDQEGLSGPAGDMPEST